VRYLLDTSAYWQARISQPVAVRLDELARNEQLAVCAPMMLSVLANARDGRDWADIRGALGALPRVELTNPLSAVDLHGDLVRRGPLRPCVVDVLVAATAVEHSLTVLHYDAGTQRLTEAAGGTSEWVARVKGNP
jgi:predicted nucleic acid-binding protein